MDSSDGLSTSPIAIFGHVDVEPDVRDELVASVADLQRSTRADEPGCLVYVIAADPADPGRIQIAELWESAEALEAHFRHPNFSATGDALRRVNRLGGGSRKYRIDATDDVRCKRPGIGGLPVGRRLTVATRIAPTRMTAVQSALDDLVTLLALEPIEVNIFRGRSPDENRQRVFGGQVAGQALVAAARTVDDSSRLVHSLHAYFLRPGDPTVPILYEVDRLRDGRSFTTRRVVAIQHGRAIFNLQASFHGPEPGPDHQMAMPTNVPDPGSLEDWHTRMAPYKDQMGDWYDRPRPIDVRYVDGDPISRKGVPTDGQRVWLRADGHLPDDPVVHACVVTYASDMTLLDTTVLPFGLAWDSPGMQMASLDHAMWFHRPFRADEWLLYDQHAFSTGAARGLAGGAIYTADGRLVVSVVQEGLARVGR